MRVRVLICRIQKAFYEIIRHLVLGSREQRSTLTHIEIRLQSVTDKVMNAGYVLSVARCAPCLVLIFLSVWFQERPSQFKTVLKHVP